MLSENSSVLGLNAAPSHVPYAPKGMPSLPATSGRAASLELGRSRRRRRGEYDHCGVRDPVCGGDDREPTRSPARGIQAASGDGSTGPAERDVNRNAITADGMEREQGKESNHD